MSSVRERARAGWPPDESIEGQIRERNRFEAGLVVQFIGSSLTRPGQARADEVGHVRNGLAGFQQPPDLEHMDHNCKNADQQRYSCKYLHRKPSELVMTDA